jgi:hypothetical protein
MRVKQRLVTFQDNGHKYEISWGGWDCDMEPGDSGWENFYLSADGEDWTFFDVRDDPRSYSDDRLIEIAREIIAEEEG